MFVPPPVLRAFKISPWPRPRWEWPVLQSHRGFWVEGQRENTLGSLSYSKKIGYKMVEIDVRLSSDNVPVLAHDKDLVRLSRLNVSVAEMDSQELQRLGYHTLSDVLKTKDRPDFINIEIKNDDRLDKLLELKVIDVIRKTKKQEEVVVSSFNPLSLRVFAKEVPEIPRSLLIELDKKTKLSYWRLIGNFVAHAHMINWPYQLLTEPLVEFLRDQDIPVACWTVNDYSLGKTLIDWGVQSLITDRLLPDQFAAFKD